MVCVVEAKSHHNIRGELFSRNPERNMTVHNQFIEEKEENIFVKKNESRDPFCIEA
jgi:hypothetical protein